MAPEAKACRVRWRDDWQCPGDSTGLHTCAVVGEHTRHLCESRVATESRLAAGSICADGQRSTIPAGRVHHHPLPDGSPCVLEEGYC